MYFLRFKRLPFVLGALIGLLLPFPEEYARGAHLWGFICVSVMLVEHILMVCVAVRFGGFKEGVTVAGWALLVAGMTLPEFYQKAQDLHAQVHAEWEREHKLAQDRAAAQRAAMRAAVEERARRYSRRLSRLVGGDADAVHRASTGLVQLDPAAAEEKLRRAERLAMFLQQASPLGDEHMAHLTALFQRPITLTEADTAAQAYLCQVRREARLLQDADELGIRSRVDQLLTQHGVEAAEAEVIRRRHLSEREQELRNLQAAVDAAPPHYHGHLKDLLARVRSELSNPREFRKAVHALRQRLPKNGHVH